MKAEKKKLVIYYQYFDRVMGRQNIMLHFLQLMKLENCSKNLIFFYLNHKKKP